MSGVIAVIPARAGSKGIVDKNIKSLAGRPLMAYSIVAAKLAQTVDRVIVSTDSEAYAEIAKEYGAEAPFLRPEEISGDTNTDYEFIKHLLDWLQEHDGALPEYLVHLRPTTPLREIRYIDAAIEAIKRDKKATALRSIHEMSESAYKTFEVEEGRLKSVGSGTFDLDVANEARQQFAKTYQANGYVDVLVISYILKHHQIHGDHVMAYVTSPIVEVDAQNDFDYLEYQATKNPSMVKELFP